MAASEDKQLSLVGSAVQDARTLAVSASLQVNNASPAASCRTDEAAEVAAFEAAKGAANLGLSNPIVGALLLANTLLGGTGMLGVPHAFAVAGYAIGTLLLVTFGTFSAFGCHLLQCAARKIGHAPCSFYTVAGAVAPRWTWLIDGAVMVKCFGVATSYLIIVGDLAPVAIQHFGLHSARRWQIVVAGFAVGGCLASFRSLSALRYTAAGSVLIVVWTIVLLGLFLADPGPEFDPCASEHQPGLLAGRSECGGGDFEPVVANDTMKLLKAFPVFIFAFTCQQNIFTVCNEVRSATRQRINAIIASAYFVAGVAFLTAAFFGYATYGDHVEADVLKGYPFKTAVQLTRLLYSCLAVFSYPLQVHPCRTSALALWSLCGRPAEAAWQFKIVTFVILAASVSIAVSVTDLGIMLGVVGATGSTAVSYILPGILYMQAFPEKHTKRYFAMLQLTLGCIIMPTCLTLVFL